MKPIKILVYLIAIAAFEGALHEYCWVSTSHANVHQHNRALHELKKESTLSAWGKMMLNMIHSFWAFLFGLAWRIWHSIHEPLEIVLMAFELTQCCKVISARFKGGVSHQIKIG